MIDENMIYEAQRMLHERCMYYKQAANKSTDKEFKIHCGFAAFAYKSACDILLAAVQGNAEVLKEFDYFEEDDENESDWCDEDPDNGWEL